MSDQSGRSPFITESSSMTMLGLRGSFTKMGSAASSTSPDWLNNGEQEIPRFDELPSLNSIRAGRGILILDPNKAAKSSGGHLELQQILNKRGFRDINGAPFREDGRPSASIFRLIQTIQGETGLKRTSELDKDTLEVIDPSPTLENLRIGRVRVRRTQEFRRPGNLIIQEIQRRIALFQGSAFKVDGPVETSGAFGRQLEQIILQFRRYFYLTERSEIDACVVRLLDGESVLNLVAEGLAVLLPQRSGRQSSPREIGEVQRDLREILKRFNYPNDLKISGHLDEATSRGLAFIQEISECTKLSERGALDQETLLLIKQLTSQGTEKTRDLAESAKRIIAVRNLIQRLSSPQQEDLWVKLQDNSRDSYALIRPLNRLLLEIGVDLGDPSSIRSLQQKFNILDSSEVDGITANAIFDLVRYEWHLRRRPEIGRPNDAIAHLLFRLDQPNGVIKLSQQINSFGTMSLLYKDQFGMPHVIECRAQLRAVRLPNEDLTDPSLISIGRMLRAWEDAATNCPIPEIDSVNALILGAKTLANRIKRSISETMCVQSGRWGLKLLPIPDQKVLNKFAIDSLPAHTMTRLHTMSRNPEEIEAQGVECLALPA